MYIWNAVGRSAFRNIVTTRNFEVMCDKFNIITVCDKVKSFAEYVRNTTTNATNIIAATDTILQ